MHIVASKSVWTKKTRFKYLNLTELNTEYQTKWHLQTNAARAVHRTNFNFLLYISRVLLINWSECGFVG